MTKVAVGASSADDLRRWLEAQPNTFTSTRNLPRRKDEMIGGSLYWILSHTIIGRTPIRGFTQREDRRWNIMLEPRLIAVDPTPRRAHQGWRYLTDADAPPDLPSGESATMPTMPAELLMELRRLCLL